MRSACGAISTDLSPSIGGFLCLSCAWHARLEAHMTEHTFQVPGCCVR
jgi:hypothetical protein